LAKYPWRGYGSAWVLALLLMMMMMMMMDAPK
jgi:hypothetical protein